jgi:SAM-dependent methyltransferase
MRPSMTSQYDELYSGDYRNQLAGFEFARWDAIAHFVRRVLKLPSNGRILDYGAGIGLYTKLWERLFPQGELHFCDLSAVAKGKFAANYPSHAPRYFLLDQGTASCPDNFFDVVVSVEVMEHVENLSEYLRDILRILKPHGHFIWTTPCANLFSIEHVYGVLTRQIEPTTEGYRRWKWEDPTHVRRLKTREIEERLIQCGFSDVQFRMRSHLFSFVFSTWPLTVLDKLGRNLMKLDYKLFRKLPNGASMIGSARKLTSNVSTGPI